MKGCITRGGWSVNGASLLTPNEISPPNFQSRNLVKSFPGTRFVSSAKIQIFGRRYQKQEIVMVSLYCKAMKPEMVERDIKSLVRRRGHWGHPPTPQSWHKSQLDLLKITGTALSHSWFRKNTESGLQMIENGSLWKPLNVNEIVIHPSLVHCRQLIILLWQVSRWTVLRPCLPK